MYNSSVSHWQYLEKCRKYFSRRYYVAGRLTTQESMTTSYISQSKRDRQVLAGPRSRAFQ